MNVKKLLVMMAAVSGTLVLCQCSSEAPPPPGTVRMVDQQGHRPDAGSQGEGSEKRPVRRHQEIQARGGKAPLSKEAPQARFRMAELYEARKEPADAFDQYQKLIDRHPDSPLYKQAMERQKEMAFGAGERRADQPRAMDV